MSESSHALGIAAYQSLLARRGFSPHTKRAYLRVWIKLLAACTSEKLALDEVSHDQAEEWWVAWTRSASASSQLQYKAALKLGYEDLKLTSPFTHIRTLKFDPTRIRIKYLTATQVAAVLSHLRDAKDSYLGALSYTLSTLLFYTGKRFGDMATITWSDTLWENDLPTILRVVTKGRKQEDVPIAPDAAQILGDFRTLQQACKSSRIIRPGGMAFARSPYIFASRGGGPITLSVYNKRLRSAAKAAGVEATSHTWRHSLATYLLNDQHRNIKEVQEILGHVRLETTARYTHVAPGTRKAILDTVSLPTAATI